MMKSICKLCNEKIVQIGSEWRHLDENKRPVGEYVRVCIKCGWRGPMAKYEFKCPRCQAGLWDNHKATPTHIWETH